MSSVTQRLSVMMFLQFFVWGAWFATLGLALGSNGLADIIGQAYGSAPIAAILAPLFLGLIADRFFASERVMAVLFLIGGVLLCLAAKTAAAGNGGMTVWLFIGHMLCYMPTLGLSNTIAFTNIGDQNEFPKIRVWGTIGWIVAGLLVGVLGWSSSFNIFWLGGLSSIVMGLYSFSLPHTPPPAKDKPFDIRSLLMFDAFSLLGKLPFLVFITCSTLICIPLAYYYGNTAMYLDNTGFTAPASSMTIGQMSEIFFMLLIPFFFRRLGVKNMILIGMACWVLRYLLFAVGAPNQVAWMLYLGIALHGICYDFFFVTGFMYTDKVADASIRGQAQGMLVFFTQGIGMYFGYWVADLLHKRTVTGYGDLTKAIADSRPKTTPSFVQSLLNMFSVDKLNVDATLLSETMAQWKSFWLLPAGMAAVITAIFFLGFWDKMSNHDKEAIDEGSAG
jgi:nucleoside transporter